MDRFKVVVWHSECSSQWYVVDSEAEQGEQPCVVSSHDSKAGALRAIVMLEARLRRRSPALVVCGECGTEVEASLALPGRPSLCVGYVLVRTKDNYYVSAPGSEHSYTKYLEEAQRFSSRDAAKVSQCVESERIVGVSDLLARMQD